MPKRQKQHASSESLDEKWRCINREAEARRKAWEKSLREMRRRSIAIRERMIIELLKGPFVSERIRERFYILAEQFRRDIDEEKRIHPPWY